MVMAIIYTNCGRYDEAIDELEELLALGTNYSVNDLKLNIMFDPLRTLPRYQDMIARYKAEQKPL